MKPFRVQLNAYVMAATKVEALRAGEWFRAQCVTRDMVPGRTEIHDVPESELSHNKSLQRLVDRFTRPRHGAPASDVLRLEVLRAIGIAYDGDATIASAVVHEIEKGLGYLPRQVAETLIARHSTPPVAAVPEVGGA